MAKISQLPIIALPAGDELVPVVKDGRACMAPLGALARSPTIPLGTASTTTNTAPAPGPNATPLQVSGETIYAVILPTGYDANVNDQPFSFIVPADALGAVVRLNVSGVGVRDVSFAVGTTLRKGWQAFFRVNTGGNKFNFERMVPDGVSFADAERRMTASYSAVSSLIGVQFALPITGNPNELFIPNAPVQNDVAFEAIITATNTAGVFITNAQGQRYAAVGSAVGTVKAGTIAKFQYSGGEINFVLTGSRPIRGVGDGAAVLGTGSVNLLDPALLIPNLNMGTNGVTYAGDATRSVSSFLPAKANTVYGVNHGGRTKSLIVSFDAAKAALTFGVGSIKTGPTAAFIRVFYDSYNDLLPIKVLIEGRQPTPSDIVPYAPALLIDKLSVSKAAATLALFDQSNQLKPGLVIPARSLGVLQKASPNLADPSEFAIGYALAQDLSGVGASAGNFVTGYIPVTPGTSYSSQQILGSVWYRADYTPISYITAGVPVIAPAEAAYVRAQANVAYASTYMFVGGTGTNAVYIPYDLWTLTDNVSLPGTYKYAGQTWALAGDSIAVQGGRIEPGTSTPEIGYAGYIAPQIGIGSYASYAIAGSSYAIKAGRSDAIVQILPNIATAVDLVTLHAGTNDISSPLGDLASTDQATFCGGFKAACELAINRFPIASIAIFTPIPRGNSLALTLLNPVVDAMITLSRKYGLPVCDLYYSTQLRPQIPANGARYYDDYDPAAKTSLHLRNNGYRAVGNQMIAFLNSMARAA